MTNLSWFCELKFLTPVELRHLFSKSKQKVKFVPKWVATRANVELNGQEVCAIGVGGRILSIKYKLKATCCMT